MPMSCPIISHEFKTSRKHLLLFYWLRQSLWLCRSLQTIKLLKKMRRPDHHTCLMRYAGQEARVRNRYRTIDWFQIGKGVHQGCMLWPCLFNLYVFTHYCLKFGCCLHTFAFMSLFPSVLKKTWTNQVSFILNQSRWQEQSWQCFGIQ